MNVAVFLPNWVGDAVMATPAVRALRHYARGGCLVGIARPYVAGVFDGSHWFDRLLLVPRAWAQGTLGVARELCWLGIDLAVLLPNSFRPALAAWLGGCPRRVGYARYGRSF